MISTIKGVIYIEQGIESVSRVLIDIKKEGAEKSLSSSSLPLLSLLSLMSRVLKASSKSLIILPLKSVIYYL
jgi:hypothetical protein